MQTFMPYQDFVDTAQCLDYRRLGKQRVEAWQILKANVTHKYYPSKVPWKNHPASKMWAHHIWALADYASTICLEWIDRGYNDTMLERFEPYLKLANRSYPDWIGNAKFHDSHRSNLLRKNPEFYGRYDWDIGDDLEYIWND